MDGYDIWKKLIFGTKFDPRKRRERGPGKHKRRKERMRRQAELTVVGDEVKKESNPQIKEEENSETEDVVDRNQNDIELMTSSNKSPKKKKQKTLSLMKLSKIKQEETTHFRRVHRIHVEGTDIPEPVEEFEQLKTDYGLNDIVLSNIKKMEYSSPTPIQMQAIPLLISERQILACAPTGSGKTAAFIIPILHSLKGPQNTGFRALILAPTRELAQQIYENCMSLAEGTNIRPHIIHKAKVDGKKTKSYKKYDILVSTPNRLIHMLRQDPPLISLEGVRWLIVDECDKLFEDGKRGFRDQLAEIYKACDFAQVKRAMFSATFSFDVEQWCKMNLDSVVSVSIGDRNTTVHSVKQELIYTGCDGGKMFEFRKMKFQGMKFPSIIFVDSKERADELFDELLYDGVYVYVIHSGLSQKVRDNVVQGFREGKIWVLICTELMSRGIDFKDVELVLNYDFPPTAISYIHRIGRTGRAGSTGHAITYFTDTDVDTVRSISQVMINAGCQVPEWVKDGKKKVKGHKRNDRKMKNKNTNPVKREKISTLPKYEVEKAEKLKQLIKNSKKRKAKKKMLAKDKKQEAT